MSREPSRDDEPGSRRAASVADHRYRLPDVEEITPNVGRIKERDRVALSLMLRPEPAEDRTS